MKKARTFVWLLLMTVCGKTQGQTVAITALSRDGNLTYTQPFARASLTIETNVLLGSAPWLPLRHLITSNATDTIALPEAGAGTTFYRVVAADVSAVPPGMALVPAGTFQMGDSYAEGFTNARPIHVVPVGSFMIDCFEITNGELRRVFQWAYDRGLIGADANVVTNTEGDPRVLLKLTGDDHGRPFTHVQFTNGLFQVVSNRHEYPATGVTWYGAQAFCNYRSDIEGLARCITFTNKVNTWLSDWRCDFSARGYRLPTEAEWEKAGRGGLTGHHFPWDSYGGTAAGHINKGMAHYGGANSTQVVGYFNGEQVVSGIANVRDMANGYGLYDMAGNVWEWVWDYYRGDWYTFAAAGAEDVVGPPGPFMDGLFLQSRVIRGGSVGYYDPAYLTCACRHSRGFGPGYANWVVGFRCVRKP